MALKSFRCPDCDGGEIQLVAETASDSGNIESVWNVQAVCVSGFGNKGCGWGDSIVDAFQSPVDCVKDLVATFSPTKGDPIIAEPDGEKQVVKSFDYNNKHYECKTTFLCSIPNRSGYRITWYLVVFSGGEALLQRRENISIESELDTWLLAEINENVETPRPSKQIPPGQIDSLRYIVSGYRILYEIENIFRDLVLQKFPDIEKLFKEIQVSKPPDNGKEILYDTLLRKKGIEESRLLIASPQDLIQLIDYMDWGDWITLFDRKWNGFFGDRFSNQYVAKESFINILKEIQPIRNKVAHMRDVTVNDIELLRRAREKVKSLL